MERLKPNGISHTTYPDNPATDFNEWSAHITALELALDAHEFKSKADFLWCETNFRSTEDGDEFKRKFDSLWSDFKKSLQR